MSVVKKQNRQINFETASEAEIENHFLVAYEDADYQEDIDADLWNWFLNFGSKLTVETVNPTDSHNFGFILVYGNEV